VLVPVRFLRDLRGGGQGTGFAGEVQHLEGGTRAQVTTEIVDGHGHHAKHGEVDTDIEDQGGGPVLATELKVDGIEEGTTHQAQDTGEYRKEDADAGEQERDIVSEG